MGGCVFFTKDRWCVQVYYDGAKHRIWTYLGEPLWKERTAVKLLDKIRAEIDDGVFNPRTYKPDSPLSVKEYATLWLRTKKMKPNTRAQYGSCVNKHIIPYWKDTDLRKIRHTHLLEFQESIPEGMRYNVMGCFKCMMKTAERTEVISKAPPFPVISAPTGGPIDYLEYEAQKRVLLFIPERHRPVYEFGMEYGVRICEVRALMWDCITETDVTIKRSFSRDVLMESTKTGDITTYGLTPNAKRILQDAKTKTPTLSNTFVFVNSRGKPYSHTYLWKMWDKARKKAGIKTKLYNAVRHSLACQLLDQGVPWEDVKSITRHKKDDTFRRYGKRSRSQLTAHLINRTAQIVTLVDHQLTASEPPIH